MIALSCEINERKGVGDRTIGERWEIETGKGESSPASFPRDLAREPEKGLKARDWEGVERRGSGSRSGSEIRDETELKTKKLAARAS